MLSRQFQRHQYLYSELERPQTAPRRTPIPQDPPETNSSEGYEKSSRQCSGRLSRVSFPVSTPSRISQQVVAAEDESAQKKFIEKPPIESKQSLERGAGTSLPATSLKSLSIHRQRAQSMPLPARLEGLLGSPTAPHNVLSPQKCLSSASKPDGMQTSVLSEGNVADQLLGSTDLEEKQLSKEASRYSNHWRIVHPLQHQPASASACNQHRLSLQRKTKARIQGTGATQACIMSLYFVFARPRTVKLEGWISFQC